MCNPNVWRGLLIPASAAVTGAIASTAVAIGLNGSVFGALFGGAATAMILAAVLCGVAAGFVAAAAIALRSWFHCITSRRPGACGGAHDSVQAHMAAISTLLLVQAYASLAAAGVSWVPWAGIPPMVAVLVALGLTAAMIISLAVFWRRLEQCVLDEVGSLTSPLTAPPPGGAGGGGSGRTSPGAVDPGRLAALIASYAQRQWLWDPYHGVPMPLPPDPDDCVICWIVLVHGGVVTDIKGQPGRITELSINGGDVLTLDMHGRAVQPAIPITTSNTPGDFTGWPQWQHLMRSTRIDTVHGVIGDGNQLRAIIAGTGEFPWQDWPTEPEHPHR